MAATPRKKAARKTKQKKAPAKRKAPAKKKAPAKRKKQKAAKRPARPRRTAADPVVIIDGVRTPFTRFGNSRHAGSMETVPAEDLARIAIAELLTRTGVDGGTVDEVILGCAGAPPEAPNVARTAALMAGLPQRVPAVTVQRNCGSALEAVTAAAQRIACGDADTIIAGGTESMSRALMVFSRSAQAFWLEFARTRGTWARIGRTARIRPRHLAPHSVLELGLRDALCGLSMLETADKLAREWSLPRAACDAYALQSQQRARTARDAGRLAPEITPVYVPPDYATVVERDDGIREDTTAEALARLQPQGGSFGVHTAGNSSQISDGACALLVMRESKARAVGLTPLGRVRGYAWAALEPERMGLGPALALPAALARAGATLADLDLVELNEAFAAVVLANQQALASDTFCQKRFGHGAIGELADDRLNVNGGAIALGHPVGATGARLVLTLLRELERRDAALGAATLCVGGGQGGAIVLERAGG